MVKNSSNQQVKNFRRDFTEACKQKALSRVLQILQEWESMPGGLPHNVFAQALSALDIGNDSGVNCADLFSHAKNIFERAQASSVDWPSQGEAIYTLMVRIASRADPVAARGFLQQMKQPPASLRPKLRTFLPILEACACHGLVDEAEKFYSEELFPSCGPEEGMSVCHTDVEERLWQQVFHLRLESWTKSVKHNKTQEHNAKLNSILNDLSQVCPQLRADSGLATALREAFLSLGWTVNSVKIGADGQCPISGTTLCATQLSHADLVNLLSLVERLAVENAPPRAQDEWSGFKEWLKQSKNHWDTMIDGANVGHHNQNCKDGAFSHEQINELIEQCKRSGRQKIAVVIRERWLHPEAEFTLPAAKRKRKSLPQLVKEGVVVAAKEDVAMPPQQKDQEGDTAPNYRCDLELNLVHNELSESQQRIAALAESWQRQGFLVVSPPSINDDWVALYMAIDRCLGGGGADVEFITNDELRDHFWRMRQPSAFRTWCERHLTRFHVQSEPSELNTQQSASADAADSQQVTSTQVTRMQITSVQLFPPNPFSHCVQFNAATSSWYFPVRLPDEPKPTPAEPASDGQRTLITQEAQWEWVVAQERPATSSEQ